MNNNSIVKVLIGIIIVALCAVLGYGIGTKLSNGTNKSSNVKDNNQVENNTGNDNNQAENNDDENIDSNDINLYDVNGIEIPNAEIKELYGYMQPSLNSNSVCLGYFYQNPFSKQNKMSLVLINYAINYQKKIDDNFLNALSQENRNRIYSLQSDHYIETDVVKEGMRKIFNIGSFGFADKQVVWHYTYIMEADAFVSGNGGGGYAAKPIQKVISYNKTDDEVNLTVVKAEVTYDGKVYRYVNNENTLVYENMTEKDFKFTKDNVDKFPQLKYVFKKNDEGKYYISDIVNLNYTEDFVACN